MDCNVGFFTSSLDSPIEMLSKLSWSGYYRLASQRQVPTFRKNHKAVETRFLDEPVLDTLGDSLKKALEFMAHGKGTDDPSSSLFTKRHQVSERHSGVLKSFSP